MKRDAQARKRAITEAAADEFAREGYAGARVDRIAVAAGVNKRLLYHYLGDKAALFDAVLEHIADSHDGLADAGADPARGRRYWRLLLEAANRGQAEDLLDSLHEQSRGTVVGGADRELLAIVAAMSVALMPQLFASSRSGHTGAGEARAAAAWLARLAVDPATASASPSKPRVRMRPQVTARGGQPDFRSESNSSK